MSIRSSKAIREFVAARAVTLKQEIAGATGQRAVELGDEMDALTRLLDECDRADSAIEGRSADIGRPDVSYRGGERTTSTAPAGGIGTRYTDLQGREVRMFARGESYAKHVGADESLSFGRLIRGVVTGKWPDDSEAERRIMTTVSAVDGGFLLNPAMSALIIDKARNLSSVFRAGATFLPLEQGETILARIDADPTSQWVGEERPALDPSGASVGQVILRSKTLAVLVPLSIPLFEDAANGVAAIENAAMQSIALELDRACLRGGGAGGQPLGIANWPNINAITAVATISWDKVADGLAAIEAANGVANAYILGSATANTFRKSKDGNGQWLRPPPDIERLQPVVSNQCPSSELYVGDFSKAIIGIRTDARMEFFRSGSTATTNAVSQLLVYLRIYLRADLVLSQPTHFSVLSGIT